MEIAEAAVGIESRLLEEVATVRAKARTICSAGVVRIPPLYGVVLPPGTSPLNGASTAASAGASTSTNQQRPATEPGPDLARRTAQVIRLAQLRAERDAIAAVAPHATRRLEALDVSVRLKVLEGRAVSPDRGLGLA